MAYPFVKFEKDPNAYLDYGLNWAPFLVGGETISTSVWVVPAGITVATPPPSFNATSTTIWLSGGSVGESYDLVNRITTTAGRIDDRTMRIVMKEK